MQIDQLISCVLLLFNDSLLGGNLVGKNEATSLDNGMEKQRSASLGRCQIAGNFSMTNAFSTRGVIGASSERAFTVASFYRTIRVDEEKRRNQGEQKKISDGQMQRRRGGLGNKGQEG